MAKKEKKIIIANWKMNPLSVSEAKDIFLKTKRAAGELKNTEVVVCPPYVYLNLLRKTDARNSVAIGAQDLFWQSYGAYTGEVSAEMIKSSGASYVIIGHSERRALGETDEIVNRKILAALAAGLIVVVCLGEKERDADGHYLQELKDELSNSLKGVQKKSISSLIVAYEPIFAIGKSDKDALSPRDLHEMSIFLRKHLIDHFKTKDAGSIRIIYGGSVSALSAKDLIKGGEVSGLLVGHQSLNKENFSQLLKDVDAL